MYVYLYKLLLLFSKDTHNFRASIILGIKGLGGWQMVGCLLWLFLYNVLEPLGNWEIKLKLSFKIVFLRLEQDIKKLKADLQASRQVEQELRSQISSLTNTERGIRSEIGQLRQENELLQNKYVFLHSCVN